MPLKLQNDVLALVRKILGGAEQRTPDWLMRPGPRECGERWALVSDIYGDLTGRDLPTEMPPREYRRLDCVLITDNSRTRIIEIDETQHFNRFRAKTLRMYPQDIRIAFDLQRWIEHSDRKRRPEGVGFGKPRCPLFPDQGGRHQQRAFRDALCDIVPLNYGFLPTLRIAHFEVKDWLIENDARDRMEKLLRDRGLLN